MCQTICIFRLKIVKIQIIKMSVDIDFDTLVHINASNLKKKQMMMISKKLSSLNYQKVYVSRGSTCSEYYETKSKNRKKNNHRKGRYQKIESHRRVLLHICFTTNSGYEDFGWRAKISCRRLRHKWHKRVLERCNGQMRN